MNAGLFDQMLRQAFAAIDWSRISIALIALVFLAILSSALIAGIIHAMDNWWLLETKTRARVLAKHYVPEHMTEDWQFQPMGQLPMMYEVCQPEFHTLSVDAGWGPVEIEVPRHLYLQVEPGDVVQVACIRSRIKSMPRLTRVVEKLDS
ncbi:MAG: hypothetical protein WCT10_01665 [Patescibacteria group bacterium]|jgi:hypothetical protein